MQIAQARETAAMGGVTGFAVRQTAAGKWEIDVLGRQAARTIHTAQGAKKHYATVDAALRDILRIASSRPLPAIAVQPQ